MDSHLSVIAGIPVSAVVRFIVEIILALPRPIALIIVMMMVFIITPMTTIDVLFLMRPIEMMWREIVTRTGSMITVPLIITIPIVLILVVVSAIGLVTLIFTTVHIRCGIAIAECDEIFIHIDHGTFLFAQPVNVMFDEQAETKRVLFRMRYTILKLKK